MIMFEEYKDLNRKLNYSYNTRLYFVEHADVLFVLLPHLDIVYKYHIQPVEKSNT